MRMVKRCIEPHSDGRIWGFRALILNTWQKQYERIAESNENTDSRHGGNSGNLSKLFDRYPDIKELVDILFLKKIEEGIVHESQIPFNSIHKRFLDKCRKEGIKPCSYPFTVKNLGYVGLWKYLKKLFKHEQKRATHVRYGQEAARNLKTQLNNEFEKELIIRPYQRVEFDAHLIDVFCTISMPSPFGGLIKRVLDRIWLLLIIDVFTRAILGYHLCFSKQYSADDVLQCAKNAIIPWQEKHLPFQSLNIQSKEGSPRAFLRNYNGHYGTK